MVVFLLLGSSLNPLLQTCLDEIIQSAVEYPLSVADFNVGAQALPDKHNKKGLIV